MLQKVILIDNHDSFTWNLAQLLEESGLCELTICFSDAIDPESLGCYDKIMISPGPGVPAEIPVLAEIISRFSSSKNILGICLGHQAIIECMGGRLHNLLQVVHGLRQTVSITDPEEEIFAGLPLKFQAGLYHSWAADVNGLPPCLRATALDPFGRVMAFTHESYDLKGLQFHPESYMTEFGSRIITNWLRT